MKLIRLLPLLLLATALCSVASAENGRRFTSGNKIYYNLQDTIQPLWAEIDFKASGMLNRMAYADTANFMQTKIYPCARCFLRPEVADALEKANVAAKDKDLRIVIFDCYRPYGYQKVMYEIVNNPRYVAPPGKGSNHNRGAAVDITLADENGQLLDMGNEFDDFSELSQFDNESISDKAQKNRKLLRKIMVKAGFTPYNNEWWHFDYKKKRYATAGFEWECDK